MLPEFVELTIYEPPPNPPDPLPARGATMRYGTSVISVAPDNVSGVHEPEFDAHEDEHVRHFDRNNSARTRPETIIYTMVEGRQTHTRAGSVRVCHVTLNSGERLRDVLGTRAEVAQLLRPSACPPAAETGITLDVTNGSYTLDGDCGGRITMAVGDPAVTLDPRRLTEAGEWSVAKVTSGGGRTTNYRFRIRQTAGKTFTLQQWVPPTGPGKNDGAWRDVTGAVNTLQAATRFRVKP